MYARRPAKLARPRLHQNFMAFLLSKPCLSSAALSSSVTKRDFVAHTKTSYHTAPRTSPSAIMSTGAPDAPLASAHTPASPNVTLRQSSGNRGCRGRGRGRSWNNHQRRGRQRPNGNYGNPRHKGTTSGANRPSDARMSSSPAGSSPSIANSAAPSPLPDSPPNDDAPSANLGSALKGEIKTENYAPGTPKGIVTFIGAGNMAHALIGGLLRCGKDSRYIHATARSRETLGKLVGTLPQGSLFTSNESAVVNADIVVLSVKPHFVEGVCREIASKLKPNSIVVSIAAGVMIEQLQRWLQDAPTPTVIRAMPNVASSVGKGVTALCSCDGTTPEDVMALFICSGTATVVDERMLPAVTALSGCGIAYCMMFAEALADAGVMHGLPRDVARGLSVAALEGAGTLAASRPQNHLAELRNTVESPGGVTIAATAALERSGFRAAIHNAVDKAIQRNAELVSAANDRDASQK